jgi:hypothetical protein
MYEKKIEYSDLMVTLTDEEKELLWGGSAYEYRNQYIDSEDPKAFHSEEEADEGILEISEKWRKDLKFEKKEV